MANSLSHCLFVKRVTAPASGPGNDQSRDEEVRRFVREGVERAREVEAALSGPPLTWRRRFRQKLGRLLIDCGRRLER